MLCPNCQSAKSKVVDTGSKHQAEGYIRRRRECLNCQCRFTTHETLVLGTAVNANGQKVDKVKVTFSDPSKLIAKPVDIQVLKGEPDVS